MINLPDIDIDFLDRSIALEKFRYIPASRQAPTGLVLHNTGVYMQQIPYNQITNMSTIDYKNAEVRGYFKIDFLNVSVYKGIRDNAHLIFLMETEPIWELLKDEEFVNLLFHLHGHVDILMKTLPTSVEQLAAVLAMIRPAKRYLIGKDWNTIMNEVWNKPVSNEYYFKKSHAIAYSQLVVVHMNLLCEQFHTTNS